MAVECSQEAILDFLREKGGRVKNAELVEHFKSVFPSDPKQKAEARELFKSCVDSVAFVKTDSGVKYVCLKKKFREEIICKEEEKTSENSGQVNGRDVNKPAGPGGVHSKNEGNPRLSGSDDTPSSRRRFIQVMMSTSPQIRRNISLTPSDGDTASIASCSLEYDRHSVTLDPLEHEWMLCASDAEWESLQRLLNNDPELVLKKDFVTGFTCLHWAAKQGEPELIAHIINFAKQHHVPISVDVRSNTGYTPLHVAAMHNHMEVVKLLVGAYNADVEIRDYSGRKACQYLTDKASVDMKDIIGTYEIETENRPKAEVKRWQFTNVLQLKPRPLRRLTSTEDSDSIDGGDGEQPLRRRSSMGRMKPRLQKLKWRTSQLVHSTTFHGAEDLQKRFRNRPKTHFFD
uniref:Sosondowah ankyrin repeat domain family member C n=1 Tax=Neogobius melanostomus TaxID=47308 RepID=A0A8C6S4P1_9GOBI